MAGPKGASTQKNIDYWSQRASDNSGTHRAQGKTSTNGATEKDLDLPRLHSTGKEMKLRDTASKPHVKSGDDARLQAKMDLNIAGSSQYLRGIRRGES
jgi:hypothetical protein